MTNNQYYQGLNIRFDKRVQRLTKLGYRGTQVHIGKKVSLAYYIKQDWYRDRVIPAGIILYANNQAYNQYLSSVLSRS